MVTFMLVGAIVAWFITTPGFMEVRRWLATDLVSGFEGLIHLNGLLLSVGVIPLAVSVYLFMLLGPLIEDQLKPWFYVPLLVTGGAIGCYASGMRLSTALAGAYEPLAACLFGMSATLAGFTLVRNRLAELEVAWFSWILTWVRYDHFELPGWMSAPFYWLIVASLIPLSGHFAFPGPDMVAAVAGFVFGVVIALTTRQWGAAEREAAEAKASAYYRTGLESQAVRRIETVRRLDSAERARMALTALASAPSDFAARSRIAQAVEELLAEGKVLEAASTWSASQRIASDAVTLDTQTLYSMGVEAAANDALDPAADLFYAVYRSAPRSLLGEHALFRLAHVYLKQGRETDAAETWRVFISEHPTSGLVTHASPRLSGRLATGDASG